MTNTFLASAGLMIIANVASAEIGTIVADPACDHLFKDGLTAESCDVTATGFGHTVDEDGRTLFIYEDRVAVSVTEPSLKGFVCDIPSVGSVSLETDLASCAS